MKKGLFTGILLSQFLTLSMAVGPAALAQTGQEKTSQNPAAQLQQTLTLAKELKGPQLAHGETGLFNLLRENPESVLKPYWLYLLAGIRTSQDDPRNYLHGQKALSTAYYAWRVMQPPVQVCSRDWDIFLRLLPQTPVVPVISDSSLLQKRLHCAQGLGAREQVVLARWLKDQKYPWLVSTVLKANQTPEAQFEKIQALLAEDKFAQAYPLILALLKQAESRSWRQELLLQAGVCQARLGQLSTARQWWGQIPSSDRVYFPEVLWQEAQAARRRDQSTEAASYFKRLSDQYPEHPRTSESLATLLRYTFPSFQAAPVIALTRRLLQYHPNSDDAPMARYWLARALTAQGAAADEVEALYRTLTEGPINVYYTHLAACRLKGDACFKRLASDLNYQAPELALFNKVPLLRTVAEHPDPAILETVIPWLELSSDQQALVHAYAFLKRGNYFRSIRTLWRIPSRDPEMLRLMYPLHYQTPMKKYAAQYQLPLTLVTGLTWQESMYKADIRSSAGAVGLMQLMPYTAREVAAKAGLKNFQQSQLTQPEINIQLGAFYLREQLNRWQGELIPTIASYNAGPGAVGRWRQQFGKIASSLDEELFIERIPYEETRRYVKQVFSHAWAYAWLYGTQ